MNLAKNRQQSHYKVGKHDVLFEIIEKIEYFLANNEFDISAYEAITQQNSEFIDILVKKKNEISLLKENMLSNSSISKISSPNYENM